MHVSVSALLSLNCEWLIKTVIVYLVINSYTVYNCTNCRANTCIQTWLLGRVVFIRYRTNSSRGFWMIHDKRTERVAWADAVPFKFLTYQLPTVGYWPTVALTGNGELGFDSGEGARETATTSKEGSRRANYPILTQGGSDKKYQY